MSALPPLYSKWMTEALGRPVPGEARATCADCPLCGSDASVPGPRFHPDVRCCGHTPAQPNFVLGGILADGGPGADVLLRRIAAHVGLTPLGLYPSPTRAVELAEVPFGSDSALVCPYLAEERCTVWQRREAVCATWYCRLDRGALGQRMQDELLALLEAVQRSLSRHIARSLGALPHGWGPSAWGPFERREADFFRQSHQLASAMTWSDVRQIGGLEIATRLRALRPLFADRLAPALPHDPLHPVVLARTALPDGRVVVHTWSQWDPVVLSAAEVEAVDASSGSTAEQMLADGRIERDRLQHLIDHGVLA